MIPHCLLPPEEKKIPTVLDLKDVFFCLPLVPISQPILPLNRLVLREDLQAIWPGLGCHKIKKNSSMLFDEIFSAEFLSFWQ